MKRVKLLMTVAAALVVATSGNAHPNPNAYDTSVQIEIKGKVVMFKLQNPHSLLYVDVSNPDGSITHWVVEGGAGSELAKSGLTREFLATKPNVIVTAHQSIDKSCDPTCRAGGVKFVFE